MRREQIAYLKFTYPAGTRIKLLRMDDIQAPPAGTLGTVRMVDDAGSIHVTWDSGGTLALIPDVDIFEVVRQKAQ